MLTDVVWDCGWQMSGAAAVIGDLGSRSGFLTVKSTADSYNATSMAAAGITHGTFVTQVV